MCLLLASCGGGSPSLDDLGVSENSQGPGAETLSIGSGSDESFEAGVLSASQSDLQAGETITIRANVVNQDNEPPNSEYTVNFSSPCVANGRASFSEPVEVTVGLTSVEYTAQGCSGEDVVTATLFENGDSASVALTVTPPEVLSVSFVEASEQQIALAGIGGDESTELIFRVTGPQSVPIIGESVSFSINTGVGGAAILAGRESATTDDQGRARTILQSGTVAGPVNVRAVHDATGRQGISEDIVISTGVPEYSRFSLSYQDQNPDSAFDTDGVTVSLSIIASDQFGNNTTDGTRISFVAPESGNVQNSCLLEDGACSVNWRSTSPRPANGRLEVIAYTDGAEDFVDNNGNSVYDGADGGFLDLGEAFTDENENGQYDLGEFFFDANQNGVRDLGNGQWDGPCLTQVDASAVCDGQDTVTISSTATIVLSADTSRLYSLGSFPPPGTTFAIANNGATGFGGLVVADNNSAADPLGGNPMPAGTTITFSTDGPVSLVGNTSWTVPNTTGPTGFYSVNIEADELDAEDLPGRATLLLTITAPTGDANEYSWSITIN